MQINDKLDKLIKAFNDKNSYRTREEEEKLRLDIANQLNQGVEQGK